MTHTTDMAGPLSSQRFSSPSSPEKKKKKTGYLEWGLELSWGGGSCLLQELWVVKERQVTSGETDPEIESQTR